MELDFREWLAEATEGWTWRDWVLHGIAAGLLAGVYVFWAA